MPDSTGRWVARRGVRGVLVAVLAGLIASMALSATAAARSAQEPSGAEQPEDCRFTKSLAAEVHGESLDGTIWGRLCQVIDDEPTFADGVTITVSQAGEEVGQVTTGDGERHLPGGPGPRHAA